MSTIKADKAGSAATDSLWRLSVAINSLLYEANNGYARKGAKLAPELMRRTLKIQELIEKFEKDALLVETFPQCDDCGRSYDGAIEAQYCCDEGE